MTEAEAIEKVELLRPQRGDLLIVRVAHPEMTDELHVFNSRLKLAANGAAVLVLMGGIEVKHLPREIALQVLAELAADDPIGEPVGSA